MTMSSPEDDDKTRVKTSQNKITDDQRKISPPSKKEPVLAAPDKTIFKKAEQNALPEIADKTRVISKKILINDIEGTDKTRVLTPAKSKERLQADKTQFSPQGRSDIQQDGDPSDYGTLKNRFVFVEVLGAGGMGVVYKAKDLLKIEARDRDPYVAIKVLSDEFKSHPEAFVALQRESRKTQKIAHPNIVNVYDFDRDGETVFMTMEYMEGKPLDKIINQYRSIGMPTDHVWKVLEGISAALIYAHGQHIIHSDFKPGNIFVSSKGIAKVFDFGIARAVAKAEHREESHEDKTVFDAGNLGALTPAYASLEMLEGETPDVRDDIYALGCIAYELFSGEHPYNRMHADEAKRQKIKPKRIPGLTNIQWRAIEKALAFKREERTESVDAFWRELTKKNSHKGKIAFLMLLIMGVSAGAFYYYMPEKKPDFSEDEMRSEIELKLRLELKMQSLSDLYASAEFTPVWESLIWADVQDLQKILGDQDPWMNSQILNVFNLYVHKIEEYIVAGEPLKADLLLKNAYRYLGSKQKLEELKLLITRATEDKKRLEDEQRQQQKMYAIEQQQATEQANVVAKKNTDFNVALSSVDKQLECRSNLDMKDFDIAITKLKSLNANRYAKEETRITNLLARCIERIGSSFPERAQEAKRYAMRIFRGNPVISGILITAKDPCSSSLAGLGGRGMGASCRDKLSGATKSPVLVVVPAKSGIASFAIGKYEVTVEEINEFCLQSDLCTHNQSSDGLYPATNLSVAAINAYLKWLSDQSSRRYRLPSHVEWQYAAKANNNRIDSNRNCKLNSRGIQKGNSLIKATIGQQNAWGVVNYLGNAREVVIERGGKHLAVGGSFETPMEECDVNSSNTFSGQADAVTGFRVLREVDG